MPSTAHQPIQSSVASSLKSLFPYINAHRKQFILGTLAVVSANFLQLLPPYFIRRIIDGLRGQTDNLSTTNGISLETVGLFIAGSLLASGAAGFLLVIMRRQIVVASRQIAYEIRRDMFMHLLHLDKPYYNSVRTGDIMNRLTADLNTVREMLGFGMIQSTNIIGGFLAAFVVMFSLSWQLSLFVLALLPIIAIILTILANLIDKRHDAVQVQNSLITAKAQENFSGARVVRGYALEEREIEEYKALNLKLLHLNIALTAVEGPIRSFASLLIGLAFGGILWVGGRMILSGNETLTLGMLVQYLLVLARLAWPMMMIGWMTGVLQRGIGSWNRLREVMEVQPTIRDEEGVTDPSISRLSGEIHFSGVGLRVGSNQLLKDINLHIPAGTFLGITGATGSGKTVLAGLLGRSLDPTEGEISMDNIPLRRIPLKVLREHLSVVPQEPFLFSDTIANNVGFGVERENLPEVVTGVSVLSSPAPQYQPPQPSAVVVAEATRLAGLSSDLAGFPEGDQTMLGERGVTLSGGQRQRTAIARALARKPSVLILDDSLSAVDTETERTIIENIKEIAKGRTVIMIAHRISTLRHADKIVVLDEGKLIEEGTHEQLIDQGGHYAELERLQNLASTLEGSADASLEEGDKK